MFYVHDVCRPARVPFTKLLAVSLLFLSIGCGGFYGESEYAKVKDQEQVLIDLVVAAGGTAKLEGRAMVGLEMAGWFIDLSGAEISEDLINAMLEAAKKDPMFDLNLSKSTITDDQLAKLDDGNVLQKCFKLDLSNTAITDAGLDGISNFYVIQELKLKGSKVTPEAVKRLGDKQLAQEETPEPLRKRPKVDI